MKITLYHNNQCSKSRAALAYLQEMGAEVQIIDYLTQALNEAELRQLASLLGITDNPRDMMRVDETDYRRLQLDQANHDALFAALAAHPHLLQRPIAVCGFQAAIGRPLSQIQELYQANLKAMKS
ncbi:MAG: arsenate reductase (glutaredoxin) [Alysiella sp.]|uniref:arsenate reductase (glutaredoxin) n=1 Tax=Alysiella sp. TaxID=1872483 RepID=UPI0026DC811E|nr:arsenate reductase (glutaredoxin) [Alysiella sp.]MDO4434051.1 arsenate reductase (glutaredoxin) [Alysiella sp.]